MGDTVHYRISTTLKYCDGGFDINWKENALNDGLLQTLVRYTGWVTVVSEISSQWIV